MEVIEIARRLSELNQIKEAQEAYFVVLQQSNLDIERYEAALFLLYTSDNKKVPYSILIELYKKGLYTNEIMNNMMEYALVPEIERMESVYRKNVELLSKYPYIFKKDFKLFEDLSVRYFKIDNNGFVGFDQEKGLFGEYEAPYVHKINHYFFKDLENPIYAEDIYSQYELEYLNDNVRKSEWVAKDNHIYLHYSSFEEFQNYLQIIDFSEMLKDKKFVFLFEEENELYPIDFKKEFNIDYSVYQPKMFHVNEFKRLIYSMQYSSHNGGDFFNEIIDGHPNILCSTSRMMGNYVKEIEKKRSLLSPKDRSKVSERELFIQVVLSENKYNALTLDCSSRIVPAVYIQPHFSNIKYELHLENYLLYVKKSELESFMSHKFINEFKYIKTFVPVRRFTTSVAATTKYGSNIEIQEREAIVPDSLIMRLLNKALYVDKSKREYVDSRIVRFEDGKLNPKATFTALAEFLDVPYTESMTYCSYNGEINPESYKGNALGFDSTTVYRTYDEYTDDYERQLIEYFYAIEMKMLKYDNHYLKNADLSLNELLEMVHKRYRLNELTYDFRLNYYLNVEQKDEEIAKKEAKKFADEIWDARLAKVKELVCCLYNRPTLVNREGIKLELIEPLKLDKNLLEQPLYR